MHVAGRVMMGLALALGLSACDAFAEEREAFLTATTSISWSEEERLDAGESTCDYLNEFKTEWHDPYGEPYQFAFDDLHRFATNAGATVTQAFDLHGAAVEHLCRYEPYEEAWNAWMQSVDLDVLIGEG